MKISFTMLAVFLRLLIQIFSTSFQVATPYKINLYMETVRYKAKILSLGVMQTIFCPCIAIHQWGHLEYDFPGLLPFLPALPQPCSSPMKHQFLSKASADQVCSFSSPPRTGFKASSTCQAESFPWRCRSCLWAWNCSKLFLCFSSLWVKADSCNY